MRIPKDYSGTVIGGIFTISSLLLTVTIIIPVFSILPGGYIEQLMSSIIDDDPYSNVGQATLIALVLIFIISLIVITGIIWKRRNVKLKMDNGEIVAIMTIEYFIVHSLGFYIYWASLGYISDGQLIMGTLTSHPISSFGFVVIGAYIDLMKKHSYQPKLTTKAGRVGR